MRTLKLVECCLDNSLLMTERRHALCGTFYSFTRFTPRCTAQTNTHEAMQLAFSRAREDESNSDVDDETTPCTAQLNAFISYRRKIIIYRIAYIINDDDDNVCLHTLLANAVEIISCRLSVIYDIVLNNISPAHDDSRISVHMVNVIRLIGDYLLPSTQYDQ